LTAAVSGTKGSVTFIVMNTTAGVTNPTISIADSTTGVTNTQTYTYATSAVSSLAFSTGSRTVAPGGSSTYTVQLKDVSSNKLNVSGQNVSFYFSFNPQNATINGSSAWSNSNPVIVATNASGQASVTVNVPAGASTSSSNSFTLVAAASSAITNGESVGIIPSAGVITQVGVTTDPSGQNVYTWPTSLTAGKSLTSPLYAFTENAVGSFAGVGGDSIKVTTSNPNVLKLGAYDSNSKNTITEPMSGSYANVPTVTAMNSGTASITFTDVATGATFTQSITVKAASVPSQIVAVNPDSTVNKAYTITSTGVAGPFTIETADTGLNMVPFSNSVTLSSADVLNIVGLPGALGIRTSATGSDVSSLTIGANQGSTQIWIDGASSGATNPGAEALDFSIASVSPESVALSASCNSTTPAAIGLGTTLSGLASKTNVFSVGLANVTTTTQSAISLSTTIKYGGSGTISSSNVYYWNGTAWVNTLVSVTGNVVTISFPSTNVNSGVTQVYDIAILGNLAGTYNVDSVVENSGSQNISGHLQQTVTLN